MSSTLSKWIAQRFAFGGTEALRQVVAVQDRARIGASPLGSPNGRHRSDRKFTDLCAL